MLPYWRSIGRQLQSILAKEGNWNNSALQTMPRPSSMRAPSNMPNSIVLFNLKYSPNLGDGVGALCLENEMRRHFASWDVRSIDLAGRTDWTAPTGGAKRAAALSLLRLFPQWAGELAVRIVPRHQIATTTSAVLQ